MAEKESFLDKLKKTRPEGDGGFASKFSQGGPGPEGGGSKLSEKFKKSEAPEQFQEQKGAKRSAQATEEGFSENVRKRRSDCVYLVRGKDRGRAAWHYVLVDKPKREMFLAKAKSGSIDVAEYGEVLYSGWGQDPPENIKKKIEDEYN